jgi:hypothetical protein
MGDVVGVDRPGLQASRPLAGIVAGSFASVSRARAEPPYSPSAAAFVLSLPGIPEEIRVHARGGLGKPGWGSGLMRDRE